MVETLNLSFIFVGLKSGDNTLFRDSSSLSRARTTKALECIHSFNKNLMDVRVIYHDFPASLKPEYRQHKCLISCQNEHTYQWKINNSLNLN